MMLTQQEALDRLQRDDLLALGMDADALRQSLWPEPVVTYTMAAPLTLGSWEDSPENGPADWMAAADAAVSRGARAFLLSTPPDVSLVPLLAQLSTLRSRHPQLQLAACIQTGIGSIARERPLPYLMKTLFAAGVSALVPDHAGHFPYDLTTQLKLHRQAHQAGLRTTMPLVLSTADTSASWLYKLEQISRLQQETRGFLACQPTIERMERPLDEVTGAHYLKVLALARLYLTIIPHIQADWSIFGPKVLQLALRFGADDAGHVHPSARNPLSPSHHSGEEELRRIIRDAGYQPVERDTLYQQHYLY